MITDATPEPNHQTPDPHMYRTNADRRVHAAQWNGSNVAAVAQVLGYKVTADRDIYSVSPDDRTLPLSTQFRRSPESCTVTLEHPIYGPVTVRAGDWVVRVEHADPHEVFVLCDRTFTALFPVGA
jgi:hypothetical protein